MDVGRRKASWNQLFHVVRDQFPYSKMKGLAVKGGAVVSFEEVQYTLVFGRGAEPPPLLPDAIDDHWLRFMRFCAVIQDGIVGEVHFMDGRPVRVSMRQPGINLGDSATQESRVQGDKNQEQSLVAE